MAETNEWLVSTTDATFEADVITRSETGLVVVDFWAEWCAPCRMIGPVLESLAEEFAGGFTLVKAETEHNAEAAGQFEVAGIPAVFAVLDGQVIDRFEGALPESAIREWLAALQNHVLLVHAKTLAKTDVEEAVKQLRELREGSKDNANLLVGIGNELLDLDCVEDVQMILSELESRGYLEAEAEQLKSALSLRSKARVDVASVRSEAEANPDDFEAQFSLASALVGSQEYQETFEICLRLVEQDRAGVGEKARELMVDVFKSLPPDSELVSDYRRQLSMLLF
ncbi:tetratricopeptide repeat protein [bacterium]|nr:tetratricopeptide repeat protein [Rubripirellula sp.]MDB4338685.1 tetratricopeptide repeat protein [Rubripirellula sp.]MDB4676786.1 tetratricopeptide repeat protein [bacterium]